MSPRENFGFLFKNAFLLWHLLHKKHYNERDFITYVFIKLHFACLSDIVVSNTLQHTTANYLRLYEITLTARFILDELVNRGIIIEVSDGFLQGMLSIKQCAHTLARNRYGRCKDCQKIILPNMWQTYRAISEHLPTTFQVHTFFYSIRSHKQIIKNTINKTPWVIKKVIHYIHSFTSQ